MRRSAAWWGDLHHTDKRVQGTLRRLVEDKGDAVPTEADQRHGEYRATSRQYCLLPPSLHPEGTLYRWLNPLPEADNDLPKLDPVKAGLLTLPSLSPSNPLQCPSFSIQIENTIEDIMVRTLPTGPGKRNHQIWELARWLKTIMPQAGLPELRKIVRQWFDRALPIIRTKDWHETWEDFLIAWPRAPRMAPSWDEVISTYNGLPLPKGYDDPVLAELVRLFSAAQQRHGSGNVWRMTYERAAEVVGVSKDTAWRKIKILVFEGVVELVRNGTNRGKDDNACEWRFLGAKG